MQDARGGAILPPVRRELRYVELKSGYADDGPAWIGYVTFSKTGRTLYFHGRSLQRDRGRGISGNHFDAETGEEYWVSGVKKRGSNRHPGGTGPVEIEADARAEYDRLRNGMA